MSESERISLSIDRELLAQFDDLVASSGHDNRSEAVRDLIRSRLIEEEWTSAPRTDAVATVTLVYDHTRRELADRLVEAGHQHHDAVMASMHVHLDHDNCLEVIALRGKPATLRGIAEHMIGMKGVKHGKAVLSSAGS